jgi:hypothetical protein
MPVLGSVNFRSASLAAAKACVKSLSVRVLTLPGAGAEIATPAVTALRDLNKPFANRTDLVFQKPLLHVAIA